MDISVIIPLYNEEESLQELTNWIDRVMSDNNFTYEIIMVDDGSNDGSWEKLTELSEKNKNIKAIKFRRNYGKAAALNIGFEHSKGNVVITMDADLQDSPDEIPALFDMVKNQGYDMVSGWKKKRHDPIRKRLPSKVYNRFTRMMTGIKLHDFNCGLKAYSSKVVKSIEVYGEMHRYIPVIAKWAGFKNIGEKVVLHQKRKHGKSKFGVGRYSGYLDLVSIAFMSRFGKKPMHFFGILGSFLFFIGFVIAAYFAYTKIFLQNYNMTERPLFYLGLLSMIIGTQLFVAGFMGEMISRSSSERNKYLVEEKIGFIKKK